MPIQHADPSALPLDPTTLRAPVPSRPRPPAARGWRRLPASIRIVLPLVAAAVVGHFAFDAWRAGRAHLQIIGADAEPLAVPTEVAFFAYESEPWGASPGRALGLETTDGDGSLTVTRGLIGTEALVRASAPGHGTGFALLRPGAGVTELQLGAPLVVSGNVATEDGRGVAGARVIVLGGGQRGVVLAETSTGEDGSFTVGDVSDSVRAWTFRVLADGHAIEHLDWMPGPRAPDVRITLWPTLPARGRLVVADDGGGNLPELGDLELRILHLPGLVTRTAADGSFEFRHLPPSPLRGPVVVPELPEGWTYRRTAVAAGERVEVHIERAWTLRGRVVSGHQGVAVAGAGVYHDHGPLGIEGTRCASDGSFELTRVPSGTVDVFADRMVERRVLTEETLGSKTRTKRVMLQGSTRVELAPGVEPEPIEVTIR